MLGPNANYRRVYDQWQAMQFKDTRWQAVNDEARKAYVANAYRVLLTRGRQGIGLVTVLRRSPERLELATGDRRDDQAYRRVQAGGGADCADERV
ncbi:MAG: DNA/RNA helicase domain-containing protein, partial [Sphingobium sp.]